MFSQSNKTMRSAIGRMALAFMFVSSSTAFTAEELLVTEQQDVSSYIKGFQSNVEQLWQITQALLPSKVQSTLAPVIYMSSFEGKAQSAEWTQWQNQWRKQNPEMEFPEDEGQKESAISMHYSGTNRIQMNPRGEYSFLEKSRDYSRNLDNEWRFVFDKKPKKKREFWVPQPHGFGYYFLAQEMLFYSLDQAGVPADLQACLMHYEPMENVRSLKAQLGQKLMDSGLSVPRVEMLIYMEKMMMAEACKPLEKQIKVQYEKVLDKK